MMLTQEEKRARYQQMTQNPQNPQGSQEDQAAMQKYGRPFHMLTPEEQAAIYRDYEGERDLANAQYVQGWDLMTQPSAEMYSNGRIQRANSADVVGNIGKAIIGGLRAKEAKETLGSLSKDMQMGAKAAGDVASYSAWQEQQDADKRLAKILSHQKQMQRQAINAARNSTLQPIQVTAKKRKPSKLPKRVDPMYGEGNFYDEGTEANKRMLEHASRWKKEREEKQARRKMRLPRNLFRGTGAY